jgi:hypothetical protein
MSESLEVTLPEPETSPKSGRRIPISVINFWLDACLLVILTSYGWVSAVLRFIFPAPTTAKGWRLWGWSYDQWSDFQFGLICLFALAVVVHVMLHWTWVCSVVSAQIMNWKTRPNESTRTILGVGLLIVLLHIIGIGVILAMFTIQKPA